MTPADSYDSIHMEMLRVNTVFISWDHKASWLQGDLGWPGETAPQPEGTKEPWASSCLAALRKGCKRDFWAQIQCSVPGKVLTYLLLPFTLPFEYVYFRSRR